MYSQRVSPIDHIALRATGFDEMKKKLRKHKCEWRQMNIPDFRLWQLFVLDPSGVVIELNLRGGQRAQGQQGPVRAEEIRNSGMFRAAA